MRVGDDESLREEKRILTPTEALALRWHEVSEHLDAHIALGCQRYCKGTASQMLGELNGLFVVGQYMGISTPDDRLWKLEEYRRSIPR